jgi:hypothetical protein
MTPDLIHASARLDAAKAYLAEVRDFPLEVVIAAQSDVNAARAVWLEAMQRARVLSRVN